MCICFCLLLYNCQPWLSPTCASASACYCTIANRGYHLPVLFTHFQIGNRAYLVKLQQNNTTPCLLWVVAEFLLWEDHLIHTYIHTTRNHTLCTCTGPSLLPNASEDNDENSRTRTFANGSETYEQRRRKFTTTKMTSQVY